MQLIEQMIERVQKSKKIFRLDEIATCLVIVLDTAVKKELISEDVASILWMTMMVGMLENKDMGDTVYDA